MTIRLFVQFLTAAALFTIALLMLFAAGFLIGHYLIRWYNSGNVLYMFFQLIDNYKIWFFILIWGIGSLIIMLTYWRKSIGYIDVITSAIDRLFETDTDLIKLPNELKDIEDRLNQIKYNTARNQQVAKEAEQRKNDLVVYLAHDLKTPLTSVIGYLTLLRDEQQISEELREKYLSISVNKAERLEELINEFFEITRFNLKGLTLEPTKINLTRMLEQISFEFNPLLTPKNLTCSVTAEEDMIIQGDVKKLERVFDNLIRNAINYSFENSEILIIATQDEQGITLKFLNHGDTIPEHKLNHIFEQFYRLDTARTSKNGGAGLGLAIAKEIIELHRGTITAFSENEIIEFTIFLPLLS